MLTKLYEKEFGPVKIADKGRGSKNQLEQPAPQPQKIEVAEQKKSKASNEVDKKRKNYFGDNDQEFLENIPSLPENNNHLFED